MQKLQLPHVKLLHEPVRPMDLDGSTGYAHQILDVGMKLPCVRYKKIAALTPTVQANQVRTHKKLE